MKNRPLVSVIMPAYNAESYIQAAIDSILQQTYTNFELLIIDDASTDATCAIAQENAKKDSRIRLIANKKNLGVGANRAKGINLAKGLYICWQDSDDISYPNRIKLQQEFLEKNPEVGMVGGFIKFFDDQKEGVMRRYSEYDSELRKSIFKYSPVAQPASMYRKEVYETVGVYDKHYKVAEDLEMIFRAGTKYKFGNVQEPILKYRQSNNSLTRLNLRKMEQATFAIRRKYMKNTAYSFKPSDALFNTLQYLSIFMPAGLRIVLFSLVRGDK